jgi:ubiquinone/menaquinone biosynthesis C-methylase UbiE
MGERHERATSFSRVVDEYDRARPGYPDDAVSWLLGTAPGAVVDLGAGTGKLTATLVGPADDVVAVEPLLPMAIRLRDVVPAARVVAGTAEAIPLRDGCADTVVVGQAFHWFDGPRALAEAARVLRPGGVLGLIWNIRDQSVPWVAELTDVIGSSEMLVPGWDDCFAGSAFEPPVVAKFRQAVRIDSPMLQQLAASRSYVAILPPPERAAVLERVDRLTREHPDLAGRPSFDLPYVVAAYRARKSFAHLTYPL